MANDQEKVLAARASMQFVEDGQVVGLGSGSTAAYAVQLRQYAYGNPFTTDEGHHILDCSFGEIADPPALARELKTMPGVVEHGLFIDLATVALIGKGDQVVELRRDSKAQNHEGH